MLCGMCCNDLQGSSQLVNSSMSQQYLQYLGLPLSQLRGATWQVTDVMPAPSSGTGGTGGYCQVTLSASVLVGCIPGSPGYDPSDTSCPCKVSWGAGRTGQPTGEADIAGMEV